MITYPHNVAAVDRRHAESGLTILEMLVSSAMLALIIVGLTAMFVQTQKAFKAGVKQVEVGDSGRSVVEMIGNDLAQVSDGAPFAVANLQVLGVTNLMWGWSNYFVQYESYTPQGGAEMSVPFRTNQLQSIYILVRTNTGWTGIGYAVSNLGSGLGNPGIGVGTLYRYTSMTNSRNVDNGALFTPFLSRFTPFFPITNNTPVRLSRIADGVVHLKIRVYDQNGFQVGYETNLNTGDYSYTQVINSFPAYYGTNLYSVNDLPGSIDLEVGILEPESWDHLKSMSGNFIAQSNYLSGSSAKIDLFRQHILIRAAQLQ